MNISDAINTKGETEIYFDEWTPLELQYALQNIGWKYDPLLCCFSKKLSLYAFYEDLLYIYRKLDELELSHDTGRYDGVLDWNTRIYIVDHFEPQYHKSHNYFTVFEQIKILNKNKNITQRITLLTYCKTCDCYYMRQDLYNNLCMRSIPLAYFYQMTKGKKKLKIESPLKIMGYDVSQKSNLSQEERHSILQKIYDTGIMPKEVIIEYLKWYIDYHSNKQFKFARQKWAEDINYVKTL